ncbi:unnamed protein product, partial [Prorocentrum cordatum]
EPLRPPRGEEAAADAVRGGGAAGDRPCAGELGVQACATAPPLLRELREMREFMEGLRSSVDALRGDVDAMRRGEPPRAASSLEHLSI